MVEKQVHLNKIEKELIVQKSGFLSRLVYLLYSYQGGPPSAHATPIRLPNGQFVIHKPIYFDTRKLRNHTLYDFLDGKTQLYTSGICSISDSSVTCSQTMELSWTEVKNKIEHLNVSIPTPGNQEVATSAPIFSVKSKQN